MDMKKISLATTFRGKNFLITGTTGFLGGVILLMILNDFEDIGDVYVLIRSLKGVSAEDRFQKILNSIPCEPLQEKYGEKWPEVVFKKVKVLSGDVSDPDLNFEEEIKAKLEKTIDLVIHCAGNISMTGSLDDLLDTNIFGTLNIIRFIRRSHHAKLVHISTAYVIGNKDDYHEEVEVPNLSPNGKQYEVEEVLLNDYRLIAEEMLRNPDHKEKKFKKRLAEIGLQKVQEWGWSNIYAYSKAISERLIAEYIAQDRMVIVRPSIVESAISFPCAGWNSGYNTSAPLIYLVGTGYPFLTGRKEINVDIVPVDYVSRAVLIVSAAQLLSVNKTYYQLASSGSNPLTLQKLTETTRKWWRSYYKINGKNWFQRNFLVYIDVILVSPSNFLSPRNLCRYLKKVITNLEKIHAKMPPLVSLRKMHIYFKKMASIIEIYLPYIHNHQYVFENKNLNELEVVEEKYQLNIANLDWERYLQKIHLPGLQKWCFSKMKGVNDQKFESNKT